MLLEQLRTEVLEANLEIVRRKLVLYTFGNVSGIDRTAGLVAIKPSGVEYEKMRPMDMVVVDLEGNTIDGCLRPSSDLLTHLVIYGHFSSVGGVCHTHSRYATAWAQAGMAIPCLGTTHADYWHGTVPVTGWQSFEDVQSDYETNTGNLIVRHMKGLQAESYPGALVAGHGPFCWGRNAAEAAKHAVLLEEIARLAFLTRQLSPELKPLPQALLDKHFLRKHGAQAYYGQEL